MSRFSLDIWDEINVRVAEWRWLLTVERLTSSYFKTAVQNHAVGFFPGLKQLDFIHADAQPFLDVLKVHPIIWPGIKITSDGVTLCRER
jgi:hypothetical protein